MFNRLFGKDSKDFAYAKKCISIVSKQFKEDRKNDKKLTIFKKENYVQIYRTIDKFIKNGNFTPNETYKILNQKEGLQYLLKKAYIFRDVDILENVRKDNSDLESPIKTQDKIQKTTSKTESTFFVNTSYRERGPSPSLSEEHIYEEIDEELLTLPDYETFKYLPKEQKNSQVKQGPSTSQQSKFKQKEVPIPEIETVSSEELQILNVNQYFKDSFDFESLQQMDDREKIEALNNFAQSLEVQICKFNGEAFTLEYFLLEEQVTKIINTLTKIKCQDNRGFDDDNALKQKKKVISYVRKLLSRLESYEDEE